MTRARRVKRIFLFSSSSMAKLGRTDVMCVPGRPAVPLALDSTAGGLDLGARRCGEGYASNGIGPVGVTGSQQLHGCVRLPDQAGRVQCFGTHVSRAHLLQVGQIHNLVLDAERVGKSALRETAIHRHLPAFEAWIGTAAGTGLVTLMALARGLTQT